MLIAEMTFCSYGKLWFDEIEFNLLVPSGCQSNQIRSRSKVRPRRRSKESGALALSTKVAPLTSGAYDLSAEGDSRKMVGKAALVRGKQWEKGIDL